MKPGTPIHKFWLWWNDGAPDFLIDILEEIPLWKAYCYLHGHEVVDDQCLKPEHRYCLWCHSSTPNEPTDPI